MKKLIYLILLIGITANAQYRTFKLNDTYSYFQLGSSTATEPHTDKLILNGIFTAGVRYKMVDISINYEYADLAPDFHSYFIGLQIIPLSLGNFEFGIGGKYGRLLRDGDGVFNYYGITAETRYTFKKKHKRHKKEPTFFISLAGSEDYRGDIHEYWANDYWDAFVYSVYFKIGIKL